MGKSKTRVALCCIACMENEYIREWVEYYYKLGIDKIFIYDNNKSTNIIDEDFHDVINDYISSGFVEIVDRRNVMDIDFQGKSYNHCYETFGKDFDWICFFDCDEFLTIYKFNNIQDFLDQKKFDDFHIIKINWLSYDDNGNIHKTKGTVQERFPNPSDYTRDDIMYENKLLKSIVRCGIDTSKMWIGIHTPVPIKEDGNILAVNIGDPNYVQEKAIIEQTFNCGYRACYADGEESHDICYPNCFTPLAPKYEDAVVKHYRTKSCEEFLENKAKRGYRDCSQDILNAGTYFYFNQYTQEKMDYLLNNGATKPKLLIDNCSDSVGDMMFNYLAAKHAVKDLPYKYDIYEKNNSILKVFDQFRNTNIMSDLLIFPQSVLDDIRFLPNCNENHYHPNQPSYIKYLYEPISILPGRNIQINGDRLSPKYFTYEEAINAFRISEGIKKEIISIFGENFNFVQSCAVYVNEYTKSEDIYKLLTLYSNNVNYIFMYDDYTRDSITFLNAVEQYKTDTGISVGIIKLSRSSSLYSIDISNMYIMSMCRVNFLNLHNTTMWWGAYLNENDKADIIVPVNPEEMCTLLYPIGDMRYKNLYDL